MEFYPNGKIRIKTQYKNGNIYGKPEREANYTDDICTYKTYHSTTMHEQYTLVCGKKHGEYKEWYDNTNIAIIAVYDNGKIIEIKNFP